MSIFGHIWNLIEDAGEAIGDTFQHFLDSLSKSMSGIARAISQVLDIGLSTVQAAIRALDDVVDTITNAVDGSLDGIKTALDAASTAFSALGKSAMQSVAQKIIDDNPEEYAQALERMNVTSRVGQAEALVYTDSFGNSGLFTFFANNADSSTYNAQTTTVSGGRLAKQYVGGPLGPAFVFLFGEQYREVNPTERLTIQTDVKIVSGESKFGAVFLRFDAHELGDWRGEQVRIELRETGSTSVVDSAILGTFSRGGESENSVRTGESTSGQIVWIRRSEREEALDLRSGADQNHMYEIRVDESLVNQLNGNLDVRVYTPSGGSNRYLGIDNIEISQQLPSGAPGILFSSTQTDTFDTANSTGWEGGTVFTVPSTAPFSKIYADLGGNGISKTYTNDLSAVRLGTFVEFDLIAKKSLAQNKTLTVEFGGSRVDFDFTDTLLNYAQNAVVDQTYSSGRGEYIRIVGTKSPTGYMTVEAPSVQPDSNYYTFKVKYLVPNHNGSEDRRLLLGATGDEVTLKIDFEGTQDASNIFGIDNVRVKQAMQGDVNRMLLSSTALANTAHTMKVDGTIAGSSMGDFVGEINNEFGRGSGLQQDIDSFANLLNLDKFFAWRKDEAITSGGDGSDQFKRMVEGLIDSFDTWSSTAKPSSSVATHQGFDHWGNLMWQHLDQLTEENAASAFSWSDAFTLVASTLLWGGAATTAWKGFFAETQPATLVGSLITAAAHTTAQPLNIHKTLQGALAGDLGVPGIPGFDDVVAPSISEQLLLMIVGELQYRIDSPTPGDNTDWNRLLNQFTTSQAAAVDAMGNLVANLGLMKVLQLETQSSPGRLSGDSKRLIEELGFRVSRDYGYGETNEFGEGPGNIVHGSLYHEYIYSDESTLFVERLRWVTRDRVIAGDYNQIDINPYGPLTWDWKAGKALIDQRSEARDLNSSVITHLMDQDGIRENLTGTDEEEVFFFDAWHRSGWQTASGYGGDDIYFVDRLDGHAAIHDENASQGHDKVMFDGISLSEVAVMKHAASPHSHIFRTKQGLDLHVHGIIEEYHFSGGQEINAFQIMHNASLREAREGGSGNDLFEFDRWVKSGYQVAEGGAGDDIYRLHRSDGKVAITDSEGFDQIVFHDLNRADVTLHRHADVAFSGVVDPVNSDNLHDSRGTNTHDTRAVELVTLANGRMIMVTSERNTGDSGIASYRVDNSPNSATYGEIIGGRIDVESAKVSGNGYKNVEKMAAVTLANGATFVYTADPDGDSIGITRVLSTGQLVHVGEVRDASRNNLFDDVQELTIAKVGTANFLVSLGGGADGGINDALVVHKINDNGTLIQRSVYRDGHGSNENFLNNGDAHQASLLESFTNAKGNTFVVAGGAENGISLWTMDSVGRLRLQDARADNAAGRSDTDTKGLSLARDVVSPTETGLSGVDAGAFAEIEGKTYLFVGGGDDDVVAFRVDGTTSFKLTMVGHFDNVVADISSMAFLPSLAGGSLAVGGESSRLQFYDVIVNENGSVSLRPSQTIIDGAGMEFADSEDFDFESGILVSASDNDDGVGLVTTGLSENSDASWQLTSASGLNLVFTGDIDQFVFANGETATVSDLLLS